MRHLTFVLVILISLPFTACQPREDDPTRVPALREQGERLYPVESGGRWGFIDARGDVIIEPHFDWAGEFTNGLALVRQGDRFGYVRRNGEMAIEPQFEDAWHFSEGLAPVQIEGQWGYINEEGQVVVDPQFNLSPEVLEEREVDDAQLRPAWTEDRYGFRRQDGAFEFDARFDDAWYFSGGLARVKVDGAWGYINQRGEMVIEPRFDRAWDFRDGLAMVEVDGEIGYINRSGEYVWEPGR